jgi:hypothetical protein
MECTNEKQVELTMGELDVVSGGVNLENTMISNVAAGGGRTVGTGTGSAGLVYTFGTVFVES